jgi:ElaB/YqjD/DUF883 family membrane-anchored ribosome-binding protein
MVRSEQSGGDVASDIQTIKDDLAQLRDDVSNMATSYLSRGRERFQDATGNLQGRFNDQVETVTGWVKDRPVQTILIAGLAGLVLGKILRR